MADKPSRALVLYGDGFAPLIHSSHTHLHSLASIASCGFLSLPNAPSSENQDDRIVREFGILVDASYEAHLNLNEDISQPLIPTISERFMGMKAALITSNSSLESFGSKLGFTVLQLKDFSNKNNNHSKLLELLGFQEGKTVDMSEFDLVFLHIGAGDNKDKAASYDLEFINSLVGGIMNVAQLGSEIGSRLHFSVVLSYGSVSDVDDSSNLSISVKKDEEKSDLSVLFPRQSYTMKGENQRKNVRHHSPMLMAQWQYAVTRKDMAKTFSFKDFKENGGNLVIPADRFVHEVAFKLWKAPKYGA
ncbi:uncharacterized protein LOC115707147 [Cannabis sativa]|uniref:AT5G11810-like protein n=1 Tax=Cannabis sativa TaxID=3483 RepID=A0A7J6E0J8_CANSA|nr:uncharacterized protein LOC115707147 [Cannabis sativa]KAF4351380.1 hypothetical protein G4B88_028219 [Cannabis sativa]